MFRRNPIRVALLSAVVVLEILSSGTCAFAESFDKPLRETTVDLGPSPYLMPHSRPIQLYCAYYPTFMVKQLNDPGVKGTLWVTITAIRNGQLPICRQSHDSTERFLAKTWWTFTGVKGSLLFLEAADGDNGGMPFRILNWKSGRKIFEDSVFSGNQGDFGYEFERGDDGMISLRYLRVVSGDCSIPKDGTRCWNELRQKFGLPPEAAPECMGNEGEQPVPSREVPIPSAIVYPVVLKLSPQPSMKALPGPVKCWPVD
jgi:hypothetical protein